MSSPFLVCLELRGELLYHRERAMGNGLCRLRPIIGFRGFVLRCLRPSFGLLGSLGQRLGH